MPVLWGMKRHFDPDWGGGKIKSWNYEPTEGLKFFSEAMKGRLKVQK